MELLFRLVLFLPLALRNGNRLNAVFYGSGLEESSTGIADAYEFSYRVFVFDISEKFFNFIDLIKVLKNQFFSC
jgi:hypothetical protein